MARKYTNRTLMYKVTVQRGTTTRYRRAVPSDGTAPAQPASQTPILNANSGEAKAEKGNQS